MPRSEGDAADSVTFEDLEDATLDGDRPIATGTARAALRHARFRRVYVGSLLSNMGSWMQNVILGQYAYHLTGSATYVSLLAFAQLAPLWFFSLVGGAIADKVDRRRLIGIVALTQAGFAFGLAALTRAHDPSRVGIVLCVLAMGVAQAVHAPTFSAVLPTLVPRGDLPGAVALQSASMNLSRVVGPAVGAVLYARYGAPWVFVGNAFTYFFILAGMVGVPMPAPASVPGAAEGALARIREGLRIARTTRGIRACLLTMTTFSFFCLTFVTQMPTIGARNLGLDPDGITYGIWYATFAIGAVVGALGVGSVLAGRDLAPIVRSGLFGFAATLAALALLRDAAPAFPIAFAVGLCYFTVVTSLSTLLQSQLDDAIRGRVMALWIMAFGGTVPFGAMAAGPIIEATSITAVMLFGALVAAALAAISRLSPAVTASPTPAPT